MDALKSFVAWPIYNFQAYGMLGLGWTIASLPLILRLCTKGIKSFGQFTEVFAFFSNLPLGQHVFSSLIYLVSYILFLLSILPDCAHYVSVTYIVVCSYMLFTNRQHRTLDLLVAQLGISGERVT